MSEYTFTDFKNKYISSNNDLVNAYLLTTNNIEQTVDNILHLYLDINNISMKLDELKAGVDNDVLIVSSDTQSILREELDTLKYKFNLMSSDMNKFRFYIIKDASKLSATTANLMLKFIEEPPANTIGFLVCSNEYKIMETIRSRCLIAHIKEELCVSKITEQFIKLLDDEKELFLINMTQDLKKYLSDNSNLLEVLSQSLIKYSDDYKNAKKINAFINSFNLASTYQSSKLVLEKLFFYLYGGNNA